MLLHLSVNSCNTCNDIAKSYLSLVDETLSIGNQLIDRFEVSVGVRSYQGLEHVNNPLFGSIPPSRNGVTPYFVSTTPLREDCFYVGPDLTLEEDVTRGPYFIGLVRNLGFGIRDVISFSKTTHFDRFSKSMVELGRSGLYDLKLYVDYSNVDSAKFIKTIN